MADQTSQFSFSALLRGGLPTPSARFNGLPRYNFIGGNNDPTRIPTEGLAAAAQSVLRRDGEKLAVYNLAQGPQGYIGLRDFLTQKLKLRGITCTRDDILVTTGSGQGIELMISLFAGAGDTILCEEFSFQNAIGRFRKAGTNLVPVPLDKHGIRVDALEQILADLKAKGTRPKFLYTIPSIQNPTGTVLSLDRRHRLIALAREYGFVIFEDECYTDLLWGKEDPPAMYGLDFSQVIHIGSFSKTLAPALRIGYLLAPWDVIAQMMPFKTDGGTGALDQMISAEYFTTQFQQHVDTLRKSLRQKLDTTVEALQREFGTAAELFIPEGGIYIWLKLPDSVDTMALLPHCARAGVVFNPGAEWSCDPKAGKNYMRLCYAQASHEDIRTGIAELARICFEQTGIPERIGNVIRKAPG